MTNDDVRTVVCQLPTTINAYVAKVDGFYTIVINESLSQSGREKAYLHELNHILNGDIESCLDADTIEVLAHKWRNL